MKTILVLCGIPGSGKSTLAANIKKLAKDQSVGIISSDAIRLELNGSEESQDNGRLVWDKFYDDAFMSLVRNDITVLDATFARRKNRTAVRKVLGLEPGVRIVCIHLNPSFKISSAQNEKRDRVVPNLVLENMFWHLGEIPPSTEEGFDAVVTLKSSQEIFEKWQDIMI